MSPRAAWRLESLGFSPVYEYRPGKADWLAAGLPTEGSAAHLRADIVARRDVPRCALDDRLGDVAPRVRAVGWDVCFVVNERRVLLGRLDRRELDGDPEARVADVMKPGPVTYRPNVDVDDLRHLMEHREIRTLPVTTGDGVLIGAVRREDLARREVEPKAEEQEAHER